MPGANRQDARLPSLRLLLPQTPGQCDLPTTLRQKREREIIKQFAAGIITTDLDKFFRPPMEGGDTKEGARKMIGQPYAKFKIKHSEKTGCYHVQGFWWTNRWVNVASFRTEEEANAYVADQMRRGRGERS
jgi:hypothetical protein